MIHCSKYLKNWIFFYVKIFDILYPAVIQDIWIRCNPMENITFYFFEPKFISQGKIIFLSRQSCRSWSRIQIPNILRVRMHEDWFYFFMVQLGNHFHFPSHDQIRKKLIIRIQIILLIWISFFSSGQCFGSGSAWIRQFFS